MLKKGRKIYEEEHLKIGNLEEMELEERRRRFKEEKIQIFEMITTPTRRRKPEVERKMTPKGRRKIERSSQKRKVYGAREKEIGKITEGLRLGDASTCRKIGNFELKMVRKLVRQMGQINCFLRVLHHLTNRLDRLNILLIHLLQRTGLKILRSEGL